MLAYSDNLILLLMLEVVLLFFLELTKAEREDTDLSLTAIVALGAIVINLLFFIFGICFKVL